MPSIADHGPGGDPAKDVVVADYEPIGDPTENALDRRP